MTDNDFLLRVLSDGREHSNIEILAASIAERGCGLTVHSRASDLRKLGHRVRCHVGSGANGRRLSFYRLDVLDGVPAAVTGSGTPSSTSPNPRLSASSGESTTPRSRDDGVLELFACDVDESAGLRDTYWEPDAA